MPRGFSLCAALNADVNPRGLTTNCYFCSVAALKNVHVENLVAATETMQLAEGASHAEIKGLFTNAGFHADSYILRGYSIARAGADDWCPDASMKVALSSLLSVGEYCGLEYRRPNGTQHMIVATLAAAAPFRYDFSCADFQTPVLARQLQAFPPENGTNYGFRAWLIDDIAEIDELTRRLSNLTIG